MATSRFYGKLTATASLIDANYELENQITSKYLAEILDEQQLLQHITAIQISTCGRYGSVCFTNRELLEAACGKLLRHNISFEPDYYNRTRISIENIPIELNDLLVKELLSNYATIIGQTYYPVETYNNTKYRTGTRVYTVIKIKEHLPLKHYQFGRYLRIRYDGQPKPINTNPTNESEPESNTNESDIESDRTTTSEDVSENEDTASEKCETDTESMVEQAPQPNDEIPTDTTPQEISQEINKSDSIESRSSKRQLGEEGIELQEHKKIKPTYVDEEYEITQNDLYCFALSLEGYMEQLKTDNWIINFDNYALHERLHILISIIQIKLNIHEMPKLKPIILTMLAYTGLSQKLIKNAIYNPHRPRTFQELAIYMLKYTPEWAEHIYATF